MLSELLDDLHDDGELWKSMIPSDSDRHGDKRRQTIAAMNLIGDVKPDKITVARACSLVIGLGTFQRVKFRPVGHSYQLYHEQQLP
jgi:hypothetical protein